LSPFVPTADDFTWHVRLHSLSKRNTVAVDDIGHGQDLHLYLAAVELDNFQVCPVANPYQFFHNKFVALLL
jgi:hypothetical protein